MKEPQKVFIIEDDKMYQEIIKQELKYLKEVEILVFSSAESCFLAKNENPDLIILDYFLNSENPNNMNGHEALNQIRKNRVDQPVIFISSKLDLGLLEEYQTYRAVDFIVKSNLEKGMIAKKVKSYLSVA